MGIEQIAGSENTYRIAVDDLSRGWSTRTIPELLQPGQVAAVNDVMYYRDGVLWRRPGNAYYSSLTGVAGGRFIPTSMFLFYGSGSGQLFCEALGALYMSTNAGRSFALVSGSSSLGFSSFNQTSTVQPFVGLTYAPMYDSDCSSGAATCFIMASSANVPHVYSATTGTVVPVRTTGGTWLPLNRAGTGYITPAYCCAWDYHLVYAGEPTEPTGLYISDALRPESFTGTNYIASDLSSYVAYFPAGRDGSLGPITGLSVLGSVLVIFYNNGIVVATNTGSYGGTQYTFVRLSSTVGAIAPRSIVNMDTYIYFFAGDRFYATDANTIVPLVDTIPTAYSRIGTAIQAPYIQNPANVVGIRRGSQYWVSYGSAPTLPNYFGGLLVFDSGANGGWTFPAPASYGAPPPEGGAWTSWNMNGLICGLEGRGPGDSATLPFFWGGSYYPGVYQHDNGVAADVWNNITPAMIVQTPNYLLDKPAALKTVQGFTLFVVVTLGSVSYTVYSYITMLADNVPIPLPTSGQVIMIPTVIPASPTSYTITQVVAIKMYPWQLSTPLAQPCRSIGVSVQLITSLPATPPPIAMMGVEFEVTVDPVAP